MAITALEADMDKVGVKTPKQVASYVARALQGSSFLSVKMKVEEGKKTVSQVFSLLS